MIYFIIFSFFSPVFVALLGLDNHVRKLKCFKHTHTLTIKKEAFCEGMGKRAFVSTKAKVSGMANLFFFSVQ
jgi:hypothetical protein